MKNEKSKQNINLDEPKLIKIALNERVTRIGHKVPLKTLLKTVSKPTLNNLEGLATKFGIHWKPTAFDVILPDNIKSVKKHTFLVEGRTENGLKVYYDRFRFNLFLGNKRETVQNVLHMTKNKFQKLVS